jgi:pimeloyl-ACP methyl ester carboxylesterase
VEEFVRQTVAPAAPGQPTWFGREILDRFDIVGVEPRGVAGPDAVDCLTPERREELLEVDGTPFPLTEAERATTIALAEEVAEACGATTPAAELASFSTINHVRDIDLVRAALGEEQISFLGLSYHTLVGATYGAQFGDRLRAMVLDSPVSPRRWLADPLGSTLAQTRSAERVIDRYFASCREAGEACPLGPDPAATFDELVRTLEERPLEVPAPGGGPARTVDGADVESAARIAAFQRQLWPLLTQGLVNARAGDGQLLLALNELLVRKPDGSLSNLGEANPAVNCLDRDHPRELRAYDRLERRAQAAAPRFGAGAGYAVLSCRTWPVEAADRYTGPFRTTAPVLVLSHTLDSQTPHVWAKQMRGQLGTTASLLAVEGVGHGVYGARGSGACTDDAVEAFLTELAPAVPQCVQEPAASAALPAAGG